MDFAQVYRDVQRDVPLPDASGASAATLTVSDNTRPEIRFDYGTAKVYENDTERDQFTFSWDIIVRS